MKTSVTYTTEKGKNCHIRKSSFERILVQKFGIMKNSTKRHNFERKYRHNNNRSAKSGGSNVAIFELPSTENTIKYMHAAAEFPAK